MTRSDALDERYQLSYRADYSARYHRRRAAFLVRLDRIFTLLVLIGGAGAFLSLAGDGNTRVGQAAALIVTAISLLQVVFEFGIAGARHSEWLRRWDRLATEIRCCTQPTGEDVRRWQEERSGIETECVSELRALAVDCENAARRHLGVVEGHRHISGWQRLLIHFGTFQQDFPTVASMPPLNRPTDMAHKPGPQRPPSDS